ncbi:glycosyltransferase family 2 protein [Roseateles sp. BYS87W]|uniref:Glycosyltransferase family 2 protein n=1 Tax=Pelomonas baiyunensis TaxID=3299026 RepID=A0ABW7GWT0_9BURK
MNVFVVIVTFNGAAWIRGALQSLRESRHPCTAVVVDNASTDQTAEIVRREFPEAVLLETGANLGFGRGNNLGIRHALNERADAVFLLNQDAYVTPDAIGDMVAFLAAEPAFDIVTPLHCSPDLSQVDPQTQRGYLQRYASRYLSDACIGQVQPYYPIHGINAAAWMLRSRVWTNVGGFDPLYFMYGEDDDLIARFAFHGHRTALLPASRIVHLRAKSPRPPQSWWQVTRGRCERARSGLLIDMKRPDGRLSGQLMRLIADGLVRPFGNLLNDHDLQDFVAAIWATGRVLSELPRIRRHAQLCATPGAHFLGDDAR